MNINVFTIRFYNSKRLKQNMQTVQKKCIENAQTTLSYRFYQDI